jgi:hypothetical protein
MTIAKENIMYKSIPLGACLVCMAALIGAGTASARSGGISAPVAGRQLTEFSVLTSSTTNLAEQAQSQMLKRIGAVNRVQSAYSGLNVSASLLPRIWFGTTILWGQDGDHKGKDYDGDKDHEGDKGHDGDKDHDKGKHSDRDGAPSPTPEPSTILSFGAALLIGGGVFYSRRLRKNRK